MPRTLRTRRLRSQNSHRAAPDRRRLRLESLEDRRLLAVVGPTEQGSGSFVSWANPSGAVEPTSATAIEQGWIVRWDGLAGTPTEQLAAAQGRVQAAGVAARVSSHLGQPGVVLVQPGLAATDLTAVLQGLPGVKQVEPNFRGTSSAILPNDPLFASEWGLHNTGQTILGSTGTADADIDAPEAWEITKGSTKVVVGVIDSGIDYTHPELYRNIWINNAEIPAGLRAQLTDTDADGTITFRDLNDPANAASVTNLDPLVNSYIDGYDLLNNPAWANGNDTDGNGFADDLIGWNFVTNTNNPLDDLGHGTHVAGTIGARTDNGVGVAGVNWDTTFMAVKWINQNNFGTGASAIAAVNYATMMRQRGVNMPVTNNSWFVSPFSSVLYDAVKASRDAGMLFVASAGNNATNTDFSPNYPSSFDLDNVVSVAATNQQDGRAYFSNYGPTTVDLGAPGQNVESTVPFNLYPEGYFFANGTSMAAPHVTGVAALAYSHLPTATYQQVRDALLLGTDPIAGLSGLVATGGRLNALHTLQALTATPTADAAGDTLSTAQATSLAGEGTTGFNATIGDGLFPLRDVDLYRIEATAANQLFTAVRSAPSVGTGVATVLRLFQADGTQVAVTSASIAAKLEYQFPAAGVYYLGVSGAINTNYNPTIGGSGPISNRGDYRIDLTISVPTPDAAGQTLTTAQNTGLSEGTFAAMAKIGDGLFPLRDVDLYSFLGTAGQVLVAATSTPAGGVPVTSGLRLFDSSGTQLAIESTSNNTRLEFQLPASGVYYLGVSGFGNFTYNPNSSSGVAVVVGSRGDYRLDFSLVTPTADTAGQTRETAAATGLGPNGTFSVDAQIGDGLYPMRDVDLYRLDVVAGQGLTATTAPVAGQPFLSTVLRLFDAAGTQLGVTAFGYGTPVLYVFDTPGTYYVGVSSNPNTAYDPTVAPAVGGRLVGSRGSYHLDLSLQTAVFDSVGDTLAAAKNITPLLVGGNYSTTTTIGDGFYGTRDVDLYRLDATAGQRLSFDVSRADTTQPFIYPFVRLFNSAGTSLGLYTQVQDYLVLADGTYYLGVSASSNDNYNPNIAGSGRAGGVGDYRLNVKVVTPLPDEGEILSTAVATGLGTTADSYSHSAFIGDGFWGRRDVDLYRLEAEAGKYLRAETFFPSSGEFLNPVLRLFNSQGVQLAVNDDFVYQSKSFIEYQFAAGGVYYIGVSGSPNTDYNPQVFNSGSVSYGSQGDYRLEMSLLTPTPDLPGDTLSQAQDTHLGPASGTFGTTARIGDGLNLSRDVDLYRFEAVAGQALVATNAQLSDPNLGYFGRNMRLFNSAGQELANVSDYLEYRFTAAGTYFIGISAYPNSVYDPTSVASRAQSPIGDYRLDLELFVPTPDLVGDSFDTALSVAFGGSQTTYVMPNTRIGDGLYLGLDVDMYRFDAAAGEFLRARTTLPTGGKPTDLILTLWDANGSYLQQVYTYYGDSVADLWFEFQTRGTYYLGVSSYPNSDYNPFVAGSGYYSGGRGDYSLSLTVDRLRPADPSGPVGSGEQHLAQVTGQGQWRHTTGLADGGNAIERTSINAWIDAAGVPHGVMSWDDVLNTLPGGGGKTITGYNWVMRVDTLVIAANTAYVEGVVVVSNHDPGALGSRTSWFIEDNGPGSLDLISGTPLFTGNFTIRTAASNSAASNQNVFSGASQSSVSASDSQLVLAMTLADIDTSGLNADLLTTLAAEQTATIPSSPASRGLEAAVQRWSPQHSLHVSPGFVRKLTDSSDLTDLPGFDALLERLLTDPKIRNSMSLAAACRPSP